jgi:hypothetical protein
MSEESTATPPDTLVALVWGLYLGVGTGAVVVAVARRAVGEPGVLYVLLLAVVTVVTVGGGLAARRVPGLAVRLGGSRRRWAIPALPVLLAAVAAVLHGLGLLTLTEGDFVLAVFGGGAAVVVGLVMVSMARTRRVRAVVADATVHATWRASWPDPERRLLLGTGVFVLVAGTAALLVGAATERSWVRLLGNVAIVVGILVGMVGQERTYRATDRGLVIKLPAARRLVPWPEFRAFRVTDEAVVLGRRRPLSPGFRLERDAIDDVDEVVAVLSCHVDRR